MIKIVAPTAQRHWKWPAVINFFLGGSASGLFLHLFCKNVFFNNPSVDRTTTLINLTPAIMTMVGLFALTLEAGRPSKGYYLFCHLKRSWMSREALFAFFFIFLSICYTLTDIVLLAYSAGLAALLFMISQGFILGRARAVTVWNSNFMPLLFFTSGICSGYGFWLLLNVFPYGLKGNPWVSWGMVAILINLMVWGIYIGLFKGEDQNQVLKTLRARTKIFVFLDGIIPLLTLMGIYFSGMAVE
ncbi:MAG: polysulfide reductase NrfD, partial [Desulfobacteraceae bacterium]